MTEQPKSQPHPMTVECPQCDGYGGRPDNDNDFGWRLCSFCGGRGIVSYKEAEEWQEWEEACGANEM